MAMPALYSEYSLGSYMLDSLGELAGILGMDDIVVSEAVNDALLGYGVSDITKATDIARLRSAARVAAWRMALARASAMYQFSADGASYSRQQVTEHIRNMLALEEAGAATFGMGNGSGVWATSFVLRIDDPYRTAIHECRNSSGVD